MRRSAIAIGIFFLTCNHTHAWEVDLHRGMTEWLARQAGFRPDAARTIGIGNNHADDGIFDARHQVFWYACLRSEKTSSELVRDLHFPTFADAGWPPSKRQVEAGGPPAIRKIELELAARKPASDQEAQQTLRKLGEALHTQQDSWLHQGEPDIPPLCNAGLAWAHPKARDGWRSHRADQTSYGDFGVPLGALRQTYDLLVKHAAVKDWATNREPPVDWLKLASAVTSFAKAGTKAEKARWFFDQKFTESDVKEFLAGITLEDGGPPDKSPVAFLYADVRGGLTAFSRFPRPVSSQVSNPTGNVPANVVNFFRDFWANWVGNSNLAQVANTYLAADVMAKASGFTGDPRRRSEVLLALWRVRDHGAVSRLGHEPPAPGTRAASELTAIMSQPQAILPPAEFTDAMIALGVQGPPLVVLPTKSGQYAALGRFRHAPYDSVMAIAERVQGNLRVVEIISVVEH
jgi:hypothetical protein